MNAIPESPSGKPRTCWSALSPAERGSSNIWPVVRLASRPSRNVLGAGGRYDGSRPLGWRRTTTEAAPLAGAGRLKPTSCITPHLLRWAVGGKGNLQYGAVADRTGDLDRPAQRLDPVVQPGQTGAVLWLRSADAIVRHA